MGSVGLAPVGWALSLTQIVPKTTLNRIIPTIKYSR